MQLRYISRGLFLILVGAIFLLANLGLLPAAFWWNALSWWPLLLIVPGVMLVFGRRVPFSLTLAVTLVLVLALSYAGRTFALGAWGGPAAEAERQTTASLSLPGGASTAALDLKTGGVRLTVQGADIDGLNASLGYRFHEPKVRGDLNGSQYRMSVTQQDDQPYIWMGQRRERIAPTWDIQVTNRVPVDLRLDAGAISGDINLSQLKLHGLTLKAGAGDLRVTFGQVDALVPVNIDVAASRLVLAVPEGVPVRVNSKQVIGVFDGSGLGLQSIGGAQATPDFDSTKPGLDLQLNGAVSELHLQRY